MKNEAYQHSPLVCFQLDTAGTHLWVKESVSVFVVDIGWIVTNR